jgi:hypothetical protein
MTDYKVKNENRKKARQLKGQARKHERVEIENAREMRRLIFFDSDYHKPGCFGELSVEAWNEMIVGTTGSSRL